MFSPWYLLGIAVFSGWLGLTLLIVWVTGRWPRREPKPKRWPPG
jgi:hypothetical protein